MNQQDEYCFTLSIQDFDVSLLPAEQRTPSTPAFREGVSRFFQKQFEGYGGRARITVTSDKVEVHWSPSAEAIDPLQGAVSLLQKGEYPTAILTLRLLLSVRVDDVNVLYNLGMALSDVGQMDEAVTHLNRAIEIAPDFTDAHIALGMALLRQGKDTDALEAFEQAVGQKPDNACARRNYGACLLKAGRAREAVTHLTKATELDPRDQRAWFGLGQACEATEDWSGADAAYRKAISSDEFNDIAEAAKGALSRIAHHSFRRAGMGGERMDAVMYCLGALQKFEKMPPEQVRQVAYEIAVLGRKGLDVNNSAQKYTLRSLEGQFSGLHLACLMYVGFKQILPDADVGFDLSKEYATAKTLHKPQGPQ